MTDLEEFRETHRVWSTNNARAMSAMNRDLMEARASLKVADDLLKKIFSSNLLSVNTPYVDDAEGNSVVTTPDEERYVRGLIDG